MTKTEALRLALAALKDHVGNYKLNAAGCAQQAAAIAAGEEALAQPSDSVEQEPEAWHDKIIGIEVSMDVSTGEGDAYHRVFGRVYEVMLEKYHATNDIILAIEESRNFTSPPKREWVGLTDDEIFKTHKQVDSMQYLTFGKAIEAKLKELNHD